jgi:hypothetical protein
MLYSSITAMFKFTTFNRADLSKELCVFFVMITIITTVSYLSFFFSGQEVYGQQSGQQLLGDDDNNQFDSSSGIDGDESDEDGIGGLDNNPRQSSNFLTYENPTLGLRMQYPSDWQAREEEDGSIKFLSPPDRSSDTFQEDLTLIVLPLEPNVDPAEFANLMVNEQSQMVQDLRIVKSNPVDFKGDEAYMLIYTYFEPRIRETITSLNVIANNLDFNYFYLIQFYGESTQYDRYLPIVENMLTSLEFGTTTTTTTTPSSQPSTDDDGVSGSDDTSSSSGGGEGRPQGQGQGGEDSFPSDNPSGPVNPSIPSQPGRNFLEYSDPELGFSIQYPAGSQVDEAPNGVIFVIPGQGSAGVIITQDVGMQLEEFTQNYINALEEEFEGFELRTSEATTLAGNPAHLVVFGYGERYAAAFGWTVVDNTAYEVSFITTQENVGNFVPIIDAMTDSFSISQVGSNGGGSNDGISQFGGGGFGDDEGVSGSDDTSSSGGGGGGGLDDTGQQGSFLTYENPTYGIRMQYPSNWKEQAGTDPKTVVSFVSDKQDASLTISVYDLDPQVTTQEELNTKNIDLMQRSFKVIESGPTTILGSNPAYYFIYNNDQGNLAFAISTIMNNKEYWIAYSVAPQAFETYFPIVQQMINSLEIRSTSAGGERESPGFDTPQQPPLSPSTPEPLPDDTQRLPISPVIDQEPVAPDIIMSPPPRTQSSPSSSNTTSNVTR